MPEISVVITVYNRSEYLREALQSLIRQTFSNWEAVVVDDYSEEDIRSVVDSFNDERFIYVKNDGKKGLSAGRNLGNALAKADIIAVADSDDIILPRRLELTVEWFREHPETDLFYAPIYTFVDGGYDLKYYKYFSPYDRDLLYERDYIPHVAVAYKKDRILELPYDETLSAAIDYDMLLNFADRQLVFGWVMEPVALYRRHADQISTDPERHERQVRNAELIKGRHLPYKTDPIA